MLAKRIIAVLTFENGELTRTKNFIADYKYTKKFINNTLFDGIVLIDIVVPIKREIYSIKLYEILQKIASCPFVLVVKLKLFQK